MVDENLFRIWESGSQRSPQPNNDVLLDINTLVGLSFKNLMAIAFFKIKFDILHVS